MFHATSDTETHRIALSLRVFGLESDHEVTLDHWNKRCDVKRYFLNHAGDEVEKIDEILRARKKLPFREFAQLLLEKNVAL
jgi:hypothetical protein